MRTIRRGGEYFRVADPGWPDPPDGRFAQQKGGRWNPPGSFPVVYLNRSVEVARANVYRRLEGQPYGPEDLDSKSGPVLISTQVARDRYVDAVTPSGCVSLGLPRTYPLNASGEAIGWEACQPIGSAAFDAGCPGIACLSAAPTAPRGGEELAWFERRSHLRVGDRRIFEEWFW